MTVRDAKVDLRAHPPCPVAGVLLALLASLAFAQGPGGGEGSDDGPQARARVVSHSTYYPEHVDRWALIVGISEYEDDRIRDLNYAHKDAEALAELLQKPSGGRFDADHVRVLLNERATTAAIRDALRTFLKRPAREDLVFVYFAAHGEPDPDRPNNVYLLTHDTDAANISGTAVPMKSIQTAFADTLLAERIVLLADTCHSAAVSGVSVGARSATDSAAVMNRYLGELAQTRPGMAIMTSAEQGEVALEDERWGGGHGVFTHFLLEGMRSAADLAPVDGRVSVGELFEWVRDRVKEETRGKQHPSIGQQPFDRSLPISITGGVTAQEYYRLGAALYDVASELDDVGRLRSAADQLGEAVRLARGAGDDLSHAELLWGRSLLRLGQGEEAIRVLKPVLEREPDNKEAAVWLAVALVETDDPSRAVPVLDRLLDRHPRSMEAGWARGLKRRLQRDGPGGGAAGSRALLIGIDDYHAEGVRDLPAARNDLVEMERLLLGRGFAVETLLDGTADDIRRAFGRLAETVTPGDRVVVHFSGHSSGAVDFRRDGHPFLYASDYQLREGRGGLGASELHEHMMSIPTWNKLLVLDTHGHAGFISLARAAGAYHVILASRPGEMALETDGLGLLTRHLVAVVSSGPDEGATYGEVMAQLTARMTSADADHRPQTPVLVGDADSVFLDGVAPELRTARDASHRGWRSTPRISTASIAPTFEGKAASCRPPGLVFLIPFWITGASSRRWLRSAPSARTRSSTSSPSRSPPMAPGTGPPWIASELSSRTPTRRGGRRPSSA